MNAVDLNFQKPSDTQNVQSQESPINDQSEFGGINKANNSIMLGKDAVKNENTESCDIKKEGFSSKIPSLKTPKLNIGEIHKKIVELNAADAQLLGVSKGTKMNMVEFTKVIINKLENKTSNASTKGSLDTSKMDSETFSLYCLLLTQSSKEKMVQTLKDLLSTKIQERNEKQIEYNNELENLNKTNLDAAKKKQEAEKKAKKFGIFKAVFSAIMSVVTTVIAVGITAASFGSLGPIAMTFAVASIGAGISSSILSVANSGCTIAALCTEDPELKSNLNNWSMGLGIAATALGIVTAIGSGGATLSTQAIKTSEKIISGISSILSGIGQIITGSVDIYLGTENIKLAELKKELDNMKIDLDKLDESIALLNKLIEALTNASEDLIKNILEGEQKSAKEVINVSTSLFEIASSVPC